MGSDERAVLVFDGGLVPASMEEFARHRAARLALAIEGLEVDASRLRIALCGPAALIDAFEMALSLGPSDCLIREIRRQTNTPHAGGTGPQARIQTGMRS